jgi:hypothetical protein
MKLAIMQPYFFPYIGYWQLFHVADRFVVYDDVNYIKGGWVNRNRLLINGRPGYITVPLQKSSPYRRICDIALHPAPWWRGKLARMVENTYRKAPCFADVFPVVENLIQHQANNLSEYLVHQLRTLAALMGITTEFVATSRQYQNSHLSGQVRVLDICRREQATTYVNVQGGQDLYDAGAFGSAGIELRFLVVRPLPYKQRTAGFVPNLSIIDALMEVGPVGMKQHLEAFDVIGGETAHAR